MTFARWGLPTLGWTLLLAGWALWVAPSGPARWAVAVAAVLLLGFVVNFFRNPRRLPQGGEDCLVSAADGVVADIMEVDEPAFIGGRAVRIGVFMNVFDVHVNRACASATVVWLRYKPGRFLDVRHPGASHANEALDLGLELTDGTKLMLRQISGWIARRIVCTHGIGDRLQRGEVFGMIKFGSRVELWIPLGRAEVSVKVGQRVLAGETIVARLSRHGGMAG